MKKTIHVLKAISSGLIWGLGQVFNRQYIKALFFFIPFLLLVSIEITTGHYFTRIDPLDKINGEEYGDDIYNSFVSRYDYGIKSQGQASIPKFDELLSATYNINGGTLPATDFFKLLADDLVEASPANFKNLFTKATVLPSDSLAPSANQKIITGGRIYRDADNLYYQKIGTQYFVLKDRFTESIDYTAPVFTGNEDEFLAIVKTEEIYLNSDSTNIYIKIEEMHATGKETFYVSLLDGSQLDSLAGLTKVTQIGPTFIKDNIPYIYYEPGYDYNGKTLQFNETELAKRWKNHILIIYSGGQNTYSEDAYFKFLMNIYFAMNPEEASNFYKTYSNFFSTKAGFFVKGYWSLVTMGTAPQREYREFKAFETSLLPSNIGKMESINVKGEISINLLLEGLISTILHIFLMIFMVWGIVDAYRVSVSKALKKKVPATIEYFKGIYESAFEYIVLSPAIFVIAFITVMPIVFGFLLAFTSVSGTRSYSEVFSWVGLKNFFTLFDFNSAIGKAFGTSFWRVLIWTLVWAVCSTFTCFFGGFIQALIINSEHVVFKKFWRTILILPWAIPSLLSQMIFRVLFSTSGFINKNFDKLGITKLLTKWGFLGRSWENDILPIKNTFVRFFSKLFYLGESGVEWLNNPHNYTFTRVMVILINIWLGFPYFMALMSGIMTSIDRSLYEAAEIDGATKWQQLTKITMPLVLYSTAPILIMTFSGNFNNFGVIYFITGGGVNGTAANGYAGSTDILISWMYKLTTEYQIYNMASVFSVLIFIFVGSITAWNLSRTRAFKED